VRHNAADAPRGVHLSPKPPTCFPAGVFPLRTGQPHRHQRQTLRTIPACGVVGAACHQRDHCLEVGTGIAERTLDARFRHDRPMGHNRTHIQSRTACPYASTGQPRQIRIQTRTGAARLIRMRHGGSRRPRRRTRPALTTKRWRRNGIRKNQGLYRQPCQFASIVFVAVESDAGICASPLCLNRFQNRGTAGRRPPKAAGPRSRADPTGETPGHRVIRQHVNSGSARTQPCI
jgi:hypothetical protein